MASIAVSKSAMVARPSAASGFKALKVAAPVRVAPVAVPAPQEANNKMMVWQPNGNKMFETFSYLPPLSDEQIARQVDYIVGNGWTPCLEFAAQHIAYVSNESCIRFAGTSSLYYDNRYWTMWKLPMFGCRDGIQVLKEIVACTRAFPDCYVRLVAFDPMRQVQVMGFLVQRPKNAADYKPIDKRSV